MPSRRNFELSTFGKHLYIFVVFTFEVTYHKKYKVMFHMLVSKGWSTILTPLT